MDELTKEGLEIIDIIREFVKEASRTQQMNANSVADFIGWLENNEPSKREN